MNDFYFLLKFMDGETVEHELDLDHFQVTLQLSETHPPFWYLRINLSGNDFAAIRNLPSVRGRILDPSERKDER